VDEADRRRSHRTGVRADIAGRTDAGSDGLNAARADAERADERADECTDAVLTAASSGVPASQWVAEGRMGRPAPFGEAARSTPMRTNVLYRVWPKALPPELCRLVKALGDELTTIKATVVEYSQDAQTTQRGRLDEEVRRTAVGFWDETHWISGLLIHYAMLANRELWNFELSLMAGVQYAIYDANSFFTWHTDELATPYGPLSPTHWVRLNRKLSVSVHLTEPDAYTGGDLQFRDRLGNPMAIEGVREQGTVVVFPSNVAHTVTPVTSGVRNSLVGWVLGPPFR
jgi:PKHD-type hydroxylase